MAQYKTLILGHTWGSEYTKVRVLPPLTVPTKRSEHEAIYVYIPHFSTWVRKRVGYTDFYPSEFVAWDETAEEWAIHQPGEDSITTKASRRKPEVRDDPRLHTPPRKRRRFRDWWASHSGANEDSLDFLRRDG